MPEPLFFNHRVKKFTQNVKNETTFVFYRNGHFSITQATTHVNEN